MWFPSVYVFPNDDMINRFFPWSNFKKLEFFFNYLLAFLLLNPFKKSAVAHIHDGYKKALLIKEIQKCKETE